MTRNGQCEVVFFSTLQATSLSSSIFLLALEFIKVGSNPTYLG